MGLDGGMPIIVIMFPPMAMVPFLAMVPFMAAPGQLHLATGPHSQTLVKSLNQPRLITFPSAFQMVGIFTDLILSISMLLFSSLELSNEKHPITVRSFFHVIISIKTIVLTLHTALPLLGLYTVCTCPQLLVYSPSYRCLPKLDPLQSRILSAQLEEDNSTNEDKKQAIAISVQALLLTLDSRNDLGQHCFCSISDAVQVSLHGPKERLGSIILNII